MAYLTIHDEIFERKLTLREAYAVLEQFVSEYNARGESSTVALLTDLSIGTDGTSGDPAQVYDFLRVAGAVLADDDLRNVAPG